MRLRTFRSFRNNSYTHMCQLSVGEVSALQLLFFGASCLTKFHVKRFRITHVKRYRNELNYYCYYYYYYYYYYYVPSNQENGFTL